VATSLISPAEDGNSTLRSLRILRDLCGPEAFNREGREERRKDREGNSAASDLQTDSVVAPRKCRINCNETLSPLIV
jgi:hypothetical protein